MSFFDQEAPENPRAVQRLGVGDQVASVTVYEVLAVIEDSEGEYHYVLESDSGFVQTMQDVDHLEKVR